MLSGVEAPLRPPPHPARIREFSPFIGSVGDGDHQYTRGNERPLRAARNSNRPAKSKRAVEPAHIGTAALARGPQTARFSRAGITAPRMLTNLGRSRETPIAQIDVHRSQVEAGKTLRPSAQSSICGKSVEITGTCGKSGVKCPFTPLTPLGKL